MSTASSGKPTAFSAADSALGYLYRCRVALLSALRRIRAGGEFLLKLETLDDVVFETEGDPPALLQTKHHRAHQSDLTEKGLRKAADDEGLNQTTWLLT